VKTVDTITLHLRLPLRVLNGGLFVSRGQGMHPVRVLDSHELIFVRSGVLGIYEADRRFDVKSGEAIHLWPGREHGGTVTYPEDLSFYWIHFRMNDASRKTAGSDGTLELGQLTMVARPDRLTELFRQFLDDQESGRLTPLSGSLQMTSILAEAADTRRAGNLPSGGGLADRAGQYIIGHFHESISASTVAKELHCNPDYLGRVFRQECGKTVTEAIHHHRIKHARKLLMDSAGNIDEIAMACGFSDAVYFRRVFKRAEGNTPGAFRRLYGRLHVNTA
jgi:AraC-like DNA-binding protein